MHIIVWFKCFCLLVEHSLATWPFLVQWEMGKLLRNAFCRRIEISIGQQDKPIGFRYTKMFRIFSFIVGF